MTATSSVAMTILHYSKCLVTTLCTACTAPITSPFLPGLEFIEEEFIEPLAEDDIEGEDIGSVEEPVELLSRSEMEELEKDLADIELGI